MSRGAPPDPSSPASQDPTMAARRYGDGSGEGGGERRVRGGAAAGASPRVAEREGKGRRGGVAHHHWPVSHSRWRGEGPSDLPAGPTSGNGKVGFGREETGGG
jgi:hypothetical protein